VIRTLAWLVLLSGAAHAATVRGLVTLPADARASERDGHWRVENGVLPVGPRLPDPRSDVVVMLEGGPAREAKKEEKAATVTVQLKGLRLDPRVVVAAPGTSVTFKNEDRVPHTLYADGAQTAIPPEPTPSGTSRTVKLTGRGEYTVRDQDWPHIEGAVVITDAYAVQCDDKGQFKTDVPEGRYVLKVWYHGAWVHSQPIEVGPRTTELKIDVLPASIRKAQ
jgi:plastocyanin